ncbi:MAG TPA: Flp family type IVb pilin [Myxococcota bacterium]|nr:Flp family type IVb pilin [Myxococcota bacterium]
MEPRTLVTRLAQGLRRLSEEEEGVVAVEYAIIAALVSLAILAPATTFGRALGEVFLDLARGMEQRH